MKKKYLNTLKNIIPILSSSTDNVENSLVLSHTKLLFSLNCLKSHINYRYNLLSCISGVDFIHSQYRFSVVYELI